MLPPGAKSERKEPTLEKDDTTSFLSVDPTLMAVEIQPGALMKSVWEPLPAAMTVAMLTERSWSMAAFVGASVVSQGVLEPPPPRLKLAEAILNDVRNA